MAQEHDAGAEKCGGFILQQIRSSVAPYQQVFSPSLRRIGDWGWPRPDYVCYDDNKHVSYALEYKPPMQSKREYVCGLGQTITYLQKHTYSGLILPERADDGFQIAAYIKDVLASDVMKNTPISLYSYKPEDFSVSILKAIRGERTFTASASATDEGNKTFWCWWRDMSFYEVYDLLKLSFQYADLEGDIYTDHIFPDFWRRLTTGKCKDFEGHFRHVQDSSPGSYKQNYRIPFEQLGLWTSKEGKLSDVGFKLLEIGTRYGSDSANFKNALSYLILTTGHHIDLIHAVDEIQQSYQSGTSMEFKQILDDELTDRGLIGKRKPTAVTTNKKGSYIRDELKLWNKMGLLHCTGNRYFDPQRGLSFNWSRITDVLTNGKQW